MDIAVLATSVALRSSTHFHCCLRWPVDVYDQSLCVRLHFLLCPRPELGEDSRSGDFLWFVTDLVAAPKQGRLVYSFQDQQRGLGHPQRLLLVLAKYPADPGVLQAGQG
jgi:hypothetical protein